MRKTFSIVVTFFLLINVVYAADCSSVAKFLGVSGDFANTCVGCSLRTIKNTKVLSGYCTTTDNSKALHSRIPVANCEQIMNFNGRLYCFTEKENNCPRLAKNNALQNKQTSFQNSCYDCALDKNQLSARCLNMQYVFAERTIVDISNCQSIENIDGRLTCKT
jgi:hypothetical protein